MHSRHCWTLMSLVLLRCSVMAISAPVPPETEQHSSTRHAGHRTTKKLSYVRSELFLRDVIEECSRRQDTVLQLSTDGYLEVLPILPDDAPCPPIDIALRGSERGVGMCTDVALYVQHAKARVIPLLADEQMQQYTAKCSRHTARMFLESMYHAWISPEATSLHLMQVNSEHMFKVHADLHRQIDLFLCKTHFCRRLVKQYIQQNNLNSKVWYVGHTSSDVLVADSRFAQRQQQQQLASAAHDLPTNSSSSDAFVNMKTGFPQVPLHPTDHEMHRRPDIIAEYNHFLHVKGKSGLKHTSQLLECWVQQPEFPLLVVVGFLSAEDAAVKGVAEAQNVLLLPHPVEDQEQQQAVLSIAQRLAVASAAADKAAKEQQKAAAAAQAVTSKPKSIPQLMASGGHEQRTQVAMAEAATLATVASTDKAAARNLSGSGVRQLLRQQQDRTADDITTGGSCIQQYTSSGATSCHHNSHPSSTSSSTRHWLQQLPDNPPDSAVIISNSSNTKQWVQQQAAGATTASTGRSHLSSSRGSSSSQWVRRLAATDATKLPREQLKWTPTALQKESLLTFEDVRTLQANIGIHICPSEREGFGHYINEGRGAGALVICTDHPPMNELIHNDSGVLIRPARTESYNEWMALGEFADINAFLGADDVCNAVKIVLQMPLDERAAKGKLGRRDYLHEKSQFVNKLKSLKRYLARWRLKGSAASIKRGNNSAEAGLKLQNSKVNHPLNA